MNSVGRQIAQFSRSSQQCRRQRPSSSRLLPAAGGRAYHTRRELPYPEENGVGDFLPPEALKTVLEWQDGLLQRLNDQVKGTYLYNKSALQTVIETAGDREKVLAFNYASQALNNSFFLDNLKPPSETSKPEEEAISSNLRIDINVHFKTFADLKSRIGATAEGMSGSGWVWLVTDQERQLAVVPTFGAGTLLVRSMKGVRSDQFQVIREGGSITDSLASYLSGPSIPPPSSGTAPSLPSGPSTTSPVSGVTSTLPPINPHTPTRSFISPASANRARPTSVGLGSDNDGAASSSDPDATKRKFYGIASRPLYPLLCLSVHEHAWMSAGLGVWGKQEYVRRFFSAVDWEKVSRTYEKFCGGGGAANGFNTRGTSAL